MSVGTVAHVRLCACECVFVYVHVCGHIALVPMYFCGNGVRLSTFIFPGCHQFCSAGSSIVQGLKMGFLNTCGIFLSLCSLDAQVFSPCSSAYSFSQCMYTH